MVLRNTGGKVLDTDRQAVQLQRAMGICRRQEQSAIHCLSAPAHVQVHRHVYEHDVRRPSKFIWMRKFP